MNRLCRAAPVLLALCLVTAGAARSQTPPAPAPAPAPVNTIGSIGVIYQQPSNPKYTRLYEGLKRREVLERLQQFLVPLRLPRDLWVRLMECGSERMPYRPGGPATLCYETVDKIVTITTKNTDDKNEQALVIDGTFVQAALHEVALAIFDLLHVPIWGRPEDAADRLSALMMVKFGDEVALTAIVGTAKFFEYSKRTWTGTDFAEEDSPEAQRFYNYLCIAYGGDPITFAFLGPPRPAPQALPRLPNLTVNRAPQCGREYAQVMHAFDLRIMPYVDPNLVIKIRAAQWLKADEIPGGIR